MKTVCIDCRYVSPKPSGIAEMVQALVDRVPDLAPDLRFLLLRHPALDRPLSTAANVEERVVHSAANGPATMWWLPRATDLSGVDLFHAPANIMPAGLEMPCMVTVHDILWLTDPALCRTGPRGWVDRLFYGHGIRRALRRADGIATVSRATADAIAAYAPAAAGRVRVVPSGVAARFRPGPPDRAALSDLGLDPDRRFVLTVGQHAPYKNHEGAVRAFHRAFGDDPGVDLLFVQRRGRGADRLTALAKALGIDTRVRLLPVVPPETLVSLYRAAEMLLHPSLCEGFGMPVAEAMACGCPVVTSDRSAMPEVAGGAALLADPDNGAAIARQLRRVADDPALAARLRRAGPERAARLDWNGFAYDTLTLYRRLLTITAP